jgi:hypothetical protein
MVNNLLTLFMDFQLPPVVVITGGSDHQLSPGFVAFWSASSWRQVLLVSNFAYSVKDFRLPPLH